MTSRRHIRYTDFKVGDKVRSRYRSPWYGTVVEVERRKNFDGGGDNNPLLHVRQELDSCGNPIRLKKVVVYDAAWFDLEDI